MQIIPMRDLKNTVEVERRCAEENGPVYVTKNGYGRLVVIDVYKRQVYNNTQQQNTFQGQVKFLTGGIAHEPQGMIRCNSEADSTVWMKEKVIEQLCIH